MEDIEKAKKVILNSYDLRLYDKMCNFPRCRSPPDFIVDVYHFTLRKNTTISKIFLCNEHINSTEGLMKTLRKSFPDIIIQANKGAIAQTGRAHTPKRSSNG